MIEDSKNLLILKMDILILSLILKQVLKLKKRLFPCRNVYCILFSNKPLVYSMMMKYTYFKKAKTAEDYGIVYFNGPFLTDCGNFVFKNLNRLKDRFSECKTKPVKHTSAYLALLYLYYFVMRLPYYYYSLINKLCFTG